MEQEKFKIALGIIAGTINHPVPPKQLYILTGSETLPDGVDFIKVKEIAVETVSNIVFNLEKTIDRNKFDPRFLN